MDDLLARRLIFVMGKGGVGKTTLSAALAMIAARMGKRVLLTEVGDSDVVGQLFINKTLPEAPLKIAGKIWGARVNPKKELEEYTFTHVGSGFIANRITQSRFFDYLVEAAPGLKEVMSLGRIWRWEGMGGKSKPDYDLIIVDAPATGHGLNLLRLPKMLADMIRVGPIASQIRDLQRLLQDPDKTCLTLVALPEELSINETIGLYDAAENELSMPISTIFMNKVYDRLFSSEDRLKIEDLRISCSQENKIRPLLKAAQHRMLRIDTQQFYIDQIRTRTRQRVVEVPFYFTNNLSLSDIGEISHMMLR